jgi:hypothetical protein
VARAASAAKTSAGLASVLPPMSSVDFDAFEEGVVEEALLGRLRVLVRVL